MRTRPVVCATATIALLLGGLLLPAVSGAESPVPDDDRSFERIPVAGIDPQLLPLSLDDRQTVKAMVQVRGKAVARLQAEALRDGRTLPNAQRVAARKALKARQDRLASRIEGSQIH